MVVSYTNSHGYIDPYAQQHHHVNNMTTNGDGGGNGGGGAFFKMFEEKESEIERDTSISSNPLDDLYPQTNYVASQSVLKDYINNSLLLNTEQVACTNITQHLALKSNVQETLKFLNTQAAKTMVNSRKRNYKYLSEPNSDSILPIKQLSTINNSTDANFFETGIGTPKVNFFVNK